MNALTRFGRGLGIAIAPAVAVLCRGVALLGIFALIVVSGAIVFQLDGLRAFWLGVVVFIAIGGLIAGWSFVCACIEAGEGTENDAPALPATTASNVVHLPARMNYRKVE